MTWLNDLKVKNPELANAYRICGNQDRTSLRNMVKALSLFGGTLNTDGENERLAAAKLILKNRKA